MTGSLLTYAVVTPARNEEQNLERLARCLEEQVVRPSRWIIVDNGSNDGTAGLASHLAGRLSWTEVLSIPGAPVAARGGPVVRAFSAGLMPLHQPPDIVVKLDADVSMGDDYFERLLSAFARDPRLGMASGTGHELVDGVWTARPVTGGHVWGPSRAYRWSCLQEVLPLEERMGWDGIDELRAQLRGWHTKTLPDLPFHHHRRQGERDGVRARHWAALGDTTHYMGYRFSYLLLRSLFNASREPAALAMIWGYVASAAQGKPRCLNREVVEEIRRQQRLRELPARIREARGSAN